MTKPILPLVLVAAAALAASGCGNNVMGYDATPVYLEVNIGGNGGLLPLSKAVNDNAPLQLSSVVVSNHPKNPAVTTSNFMDVVLEEYVVSWRRIDGGTVASPSERFVAFGTVPVSGQDNLQNFPFMTPGALQMPPLNQLFPFNGGIDRETNSNVIRQVMTVVFHGHTVSGQAVTSTPADFSIFFDYVAPGVARVRVDR
jgi:hypothetical protein